MAQAISSSPTLPPAHKQRAESVVSSPGCKSSPEHDLAPSFHDRLKYKLEKLDRWRIAPANLVFPKADVVGRGGTATVSLAYLQSPSGGEKDGTPQASSTSQEDDQGIARTYVAVKKMNFADVTTPEKRIRISIREIEILGKLSHRNIVPLTGFIEDISNGVFWVVLPWAKNGNLRQFILAGRWEIPERISLIYDVAEGVEYLHTRNPPIYHGDLKSLNILVDSDCRAMITDFGSARMLDGSDDLEPSTNRPGGSNEILEGSRDLGITLDPSTRMLTVTGDMYTTRWAAPEVLNAKGVGTWSDVWSFGWITFEVMTTELPFEKLKRDGQVVMKILRGQVPSMADDPRTSPILELCSLMAKCWMSDPTQRPTSDTCRKSITRMPMIVPSHIELDSSTAPITARVRSHALLHQLGHLYSAQNDYQASVEANSEALEIATTLGDEHGRACALCGLAEAFESQGKYDDAVSRYSEVLEIYTRLGIENGRACALGGLAAVHQVKCQYDDAVSCYSEASEIHTRLGNKQGRASALFGLAEVHRARCKYDDAVSCYSESLEIHTRLGDERGRASALWGLAGVHRVKCKYDDAVSCYSEALEISTMFGNDRRRASASFDLAEVHRALCKYDDAVSYYSEALAIYTKLGIQPCRARILESLAELHRSRSSQDQANSCLVQAAAIWGVLGDAARHAKALIDCLVNYVYS